MAIAEWPAFRPKPEISIMYIFLRYISTYEATFDMVIVDTKSALSTAAFLRYKRAVFARHI